MASNPEIFSCPCTRHPDHQRPLCLIADAAEGVYDEIAPAVEAAWRRAEAIEHVAMRVIARSRPGGFYAAIAPAADSDTGPNVIRFPAVDPRFDIHDRAARKFVARRHIAAIQRARRSLTEQSLPVGWERHAAEELLGAAEMAGSVNFCWPGARIDPDFLARLIRHDIGRRDRFEERAANLEFDGGLTRSEAERLAASEMQGPQ